MIPNKANIKKLCLSAGADLVGVAAVDRFIESPKGFHPTDVLPSCKSVLALCCQFPHDAECDCITYTNTRNAMVAKMDSLADAIADKIQNMGFNAKAIKALDAKSDNGRYRGPISFKHAAMLAGLGRIGKNTLLVNDKLGNMIWLSAILTSMQLESDDLAAYNPCRSDCRLCVDNCPAAALGDGPMRQLQCFGHAFDTSSGKLQINCWKCRQICPSHFSLAIRK